LVCLSEKELRKIRGSQIAMILQNPLSYLNPVLPIGLQVSEALRIHRRFTCREARAAALELLKQVGIKEPVQAARQFPHAFSGGMRQRAMIAMALACQPKLLIADEPTTSLDVVSQAQILNIFQEIRRSSRASMLFITHDLGIAAEIADRVLVMYAGELVEQADIFTIFSRPAHPYTQVLFSCVPRRRGTKRLRVFESMVAENYVKLRGCRFFSRCPVSKRICQTTHPELTALSHGHLARCLYCR
jgi:oligopeptide/dipeptide ABC transporter ATP-binding protein